MPNQRSKPKHPGGFNPRASLQPGDPLDTADFFVGRSAEEVLGRMAAYYLPFQDEGGELLFDEIVVIVPPAAVWEISDEAILRALNDGVDAVWDEVPKGMAAWISKNTSVHRSTRLETRDVRAALEAPGRKRICLISHASKYRDDTEEPQRTVGMSGTLLPEDIWVPHAVRLATTCLAATTGSGSVLVFHSSDSVLKAENKKLLTDVEQLFPVFFGDESGRAPKQELLTQHIPRWVAMTAGGRLDEALAELASAGLAPDEQREVRLHIAVRAQDREEVVRLVHEYVEDVDELTAESAMYLSRMANRFGDPDLARKLLAPAVGRLSDQTALTLALDTAMSMGDTELLQRCWDRLSMLFPSAPALVDNKEQRLVQTCEMTAEDVAAAPSRAGFEPPDNYLAGALYQRRSVDYGAVLAHVSATWPTKQPLAAVCVALHALSLRNLEVALRAAMLAAGEPRHSEQAAWILLDVLRRMFIDEVHPEGGMDVYKLPLLVVTQHLAEHPAAARMRAELTEVLDIEVAGTTGLAVLASFALEVIGSGAPMPQRSKATEKSTDERLEEFLSGAIEWMGQQPAIEAGVTKLPKELVTDEPEKLIAALELLMHFGTRADGDAEDLTGLERFAFLICLLVPHAPDSTADLNALRQVAVKSRLHGRVQRARDLAEQLLKLAGSASHRRRIAWSSYADILHQTGSTVDALIGLACASRSGAHINAANLYQEAYVLLRIARDLRLFSVARSALASCRKLYAIEGVGESGRRRLDGIELSLDMARVADMTPDELRELLERTRAHCAEVLEFGDEIFSAAAHFLQIAGAVERSGQDLPPAARELRASLQRQNVGGLLHAMSAAFPTPEEVVEHYNQLEAARYSGDAAADQRAIVIAAHRLLLVRAPEILPEQAAVAVELLSDRTLRTTSKHRLDAAWPGSFISELSKNGLSVLMLGLDDEGELAGALARQGEVSLVRPPVEERSFAARLGAWGADYPYGYGLINREDGNGEIYSSMGALNLPMPDVERLLVVAQPALQQVPLNVALVNGEFAGVGTAIGSVPSLTWLKDVWLRPRSGTTRRLAWISCAPESDAFGTLEMLYARLSPTFNRYGFETDTRGGIPEEIRGASLAVVTAHGQLSMGDRFIHRIADEQELTESPLTLARALAGVELVILFVCSGGRVDRHPFANTTVGLPKMLLDRGCRAVVASPWPLDGIVPANWLERFLEAWEAGDSVLDANFKANRHVSERLGPEAHLCMAMGVYGDVLLTKASKTS